METAFKCHLKRFYAYCSFSVYIRAGDEVLSRYLVDLKGVLSKYILGFKDVVSNNPLDLTYGCFKRPRP